MPTGYTADVQSGKVTTLTEYAMQCARAFGATIMMRDDPADKPIPARFEPQTAYNDEGLAEAQKQLAELEALTDSECADRAEDDYQKSLVVYHERVARRAEQKARYEAMIAKVNAWEAPRTHAEMKSFMLSQLRQSVDFDCNGEWDREPKREAPVAWRARKISDAAKNISYHAEARKKEIERTEDRNKWLDDLRASLAASAEAAQ